MPTLAEDAARPAAAVAPPRQSAGAPPAAAGHPAAPRPRSQSAGLPVRAFSAPPAPAVPRAAAPLAPVAAGTLEELRAELLAFDGCGLKATATNLCLYRGGATARLMIIGEAPGREDDLDGRPFVGPAGRLLDRMLAAIGLTDAQAHIANAVYWRPPGNRTPSVQEVQACAPFLARHIELVGPDVLLMLGGTAAKQVMGVDEAIMKVRGKWLTVPSGNRSIRALATLHPDYVLRVPASKRQVWRDLLAVKAELA